MCVLPVGCFLVVTESNFHEFNTYVSRTITNLHKFFFQFFPTITSAFVIHTHTRARARALDRNCEVYKQEVDISKVTCYGKTLNNLSAITVNFVQLLKLQADE